MGRGGDGPGGHGDQAGVLMGGAYGPMVGSFGKRIVLVEFGDGISMPSAPQFRLTPLPRKAGEGRAANGSAPSLPPPLRGRGESKASQAIDPLPCRLDRVMLAHQV